MTRKEALEYVNNMWMYEDTKNALETLIPEFGKTCSDKVIDHEDKYKEALLEARAVLEPCLKYSNGKVREALDSIDKELKRFESEDEMIRKLLVWQVHRNIEDETNDLAQSVYDGIKGHDPDLEESIEDWKRCLAWLEKQKENPKSADSIPSDCTSDAKCEDRWHKVSDSLPDNPREVLCKDEAGNYFIGRYYTGEGWEISNYDDEDKPHHLNPPVSKWIDFPSEKQKEQKPAEWSEEDEEMLDIVLTMVDCSTIVPYSGGQLHPSESYKKDISEWLKSLPERFNLQPKVEWSEEDIKKIRSEEYTKGFNDAAFGGKLKEWSVEDEDRIRQIERIAQQAGCTQKLQEEIHDWLKSLRPSWKPSEEQIKALDKAIPVCMGVVGRDEITPLESLLQDLKKLM